MRKYQKQFPISVRIRFYSVLLIIVILFAAICLIDAFSTDTPNSVLSRVSTISMTIITIASLAYPIMQDIRCILEKKKMPLSFVWTEDIPFVDREELLRDILTEIANGIAKNDCCLQWYMRFALNNGKESLAKQLCIQLERIKYGHKSKIAPDFPVQVAEQIGAIQLVECKSSIEEFELYLKTSFRYVRGKKNIIVVQNSRGVQLTRKDLDRLADRDIFLVVLNFTQMAQDMLRFPDDKIVALIKEIKPMPQYAPLFCEKTEAELEDIAIKLGKLSGNNIGRIINLLSDNNFSMLLETDREFLDFYGLLKQAKYHEAEKKYGELSPVPSNKPLLRYKREYEHANLLHFLGEYGKALDELNALMTQMTVIDSASCAAPWGKMLYCDAVLLQSHTLKHQGKFDEAAQALEMVDTEQRDLNWIKYHFSVNIFQLNEMDSGSPQWSELLHELKEMMDTFASERKLVNSDYYFYEAFYPIVAFYCKEFDPQIIPDLIKMEEAAIQYYEEHERRFVTNCYFIKAELLRMLRRWDEAKKFYGCCLDIYRHNGDKDILYLVAITCKCAELFEGVSMDIGCDLDKAMAACKQEEDYGFHRRLISKLELAEQDQEWRGQWLTHYRTTINPIP